VKVETYKITKRLIVVKGVTYFFLKIGAGAMLKAYVT
jgi:hypothetical protein